MNDHFFGKKLLTRILPNCLQNVRHQRGIGRADVRNNNKIADQNQMTPRQLILKGREITTHTYAHMQGFLYMQQKHYTEAISYLETAAVLGQTESPFLLSVIYNEGGGFIEDKELATIWLAIACELWDEDAIRAAEKRNIVFDERTRTIAKYYTYLIKQSATNYQADEVINLDQIDRAVWKWNHENKDNNVASLLVDPLSLTDNGTLSALRESHTQSMLRYKAIKLINDTYDIKTKRLKKLEDTYELEYDIRPRTPYELAFRGRALVYIIMMCNSELKERMLKFEQTIHVNARWYLEAAAALGCKDAPYLLSVIYSEDIELTQIEELYKIWLAIGMEFNDYEAKNAMRDKNVIFDEQTKAIAKAYANFMRSSAKIHYQNGTVSLEQIESAIWAWNKVDQRGFLNIVPRTLELSQDEGSFSRKSITLPFLQLMCSTWNY